jgi:hypothetical protein
MLRLTQMMKYSVAIVTALTMLFAATMPSHAASGTVRLHIVKAGFIVGVGGGSGTLIFQGRRYHLSIGGIGVGSLGVAAVDLVGTASNLHTAADIVGSYGAAGAGATFVGGGQVATLQNGNGVVLQLQGFQAGFQVSFGLGGMTISMQ